MLLRKHYEDSNISTGIGSTGAQHQNLQQLVNTKIFFVISA